MTSCLAL
jgi:integrase